MTTAIVVLIFIAIAALLGLAMTLWFPPIQGSDEYDKWKRDNRNNDDSKASQHD